MELHRTLTILCRACDRAAASTSMEEGCSNAARAAREVLGCRAVALLLLADGNFRLRVVVHRGLSDHFAHGFRPDLNANETLGRVVRGREAVLVPDTAADFRTAADLRLEQDAGSVLAAPVRSGPVGLGCLICDADRPNAFEPEAVTVCCLLGHLVSAVYSRSMLREQQRQHQLTDPETGVYSFDFFCVRLREEMQRADRFERGLGLAIFEIDRLDRYEQRWGHRDATMALAQIVHTVAEHLRPIDTIGRFLHRQLGLCLPETDLAGAAVAADRLRREVEAFPFPHAEPRLTLSIGVADYREADPVPVLMERATRALYRAQLEGGNRVVTVEQL